MISEFDVKLFMSVFRNLEWVIPARVRVAMPALGVVGTHVMNP